MPILMTLPLLWKQPVTCFMDSVACALMALKYPACTKMLGPFVEGGDMPNGGSKVPGTRYQLDPIQAAFNFWCDDSVVRL